MKNKQLSFSIKEKGPGKRSGTKARLILKSQVYGGSIQHRKYQRPYSKTQAAHVILRSRLLSGSRSLLKANRSKWTEELIRNKARKYQAKLYTFSVNSNHLHLLMKFPSQESQSFFLRDLAGSLALKIKKTFKIARSIKVWDARPFSSIVRSYPKIKAYIEKNKNEATGLWPYQKRPISYLEKALKKIELISLSRISSA